ncbi:hypothetical protein MMC11_003923 [Xylographa trunciseda]|nr:hypothetical protein [Xylographa trunciseda]
MNWPRRYRASQPDGSQDNPVWNSFHDQYLAGSGSDPGPLTAQVMPFSSDMQTNDFVPSVANATVPPMMRPSRSYNTTFPMPAESAPSFIGEPMGNLNSNPMGSSYLTTNSSSENRANHGTQYPPMTYPVPYDLQPMPTNSSYEESTNKHKDLSAREHVKSGARRSLKRKTSDSLGYFSPVHLRKEPSSRIEKSRLPKSHKRVVRDKSSRKLPDRISIGIVSRPNVCSNAREVCDVWIKTNPNRLPKEHHLHTLGHLFKVPVDLLREGFKTTLEDSGYQTAHIIEPDATLRYQKKRCKRPQACAADGGAPASTAKDILRPFACSHRCGARFAKKGAWEKHEQTHYAQKLWTCGKETCRDIEHVWLRKDRFKDHLMNHHKYKKVTKEDYKAGFRAIASRYPRTCHFLGCTFRFDDWKERIDHISDHFKDPYDMSTWAELKDEVSEGDGHMREPVGGGSESESSEESHSDDGSERGQPDFYSDNDDNDDDSDGSDQDPGGSCTKGSRRRGGSHGNRRANGPQPTEQRSGQRSQNQRPIGGRDSSYSSGKAHQYSGYRSDSAVRVSSRIVSNLSGSRAILQQSRIADSAARTSQWPKPMKAVWILTNIDLVSVRWLGSGATAKVDEVMHRGCKGTMARKTVYYSQFAERHKTFQEAYIMHRLRHPHVVRLLTTYSDLSTSTILMKPAADYSLSHYLQTRSPTEPVGDEAFGWFSCLISGLQHIHQQDVLHGDIKPHNILIFEGRVFYADFGLSTTIPHGQVTTSIACFGTKKYAAPEVKEGLRGRASDIFSLGCVFLEMLIVMLHHSIKGLYREQCSKGIRGKVDVSYCDNPAAVAASLSSCRSIARRTPIPNSIFEALDCCEVMLDLNAERRPTVHDLAKRIKPRFCCTIRLDEFSDHYSRSKMEPKQISMRQLYEMSDIVQQISNFSHTYQAHVRKPTRQHVEITQDNDLDINSRAFITSGKFNILNKQSSMLLRWLREPAFSYEAFCVMDRPKTDPYEHLISESKHIESLMEQLSICVKPVTSHKETCDTLAVGHEAESESIISLSAQDSFEEHFYDASIDQMSLDSINSIPPAYAELWVFSRVKNTWVAVQALLDSGTRLNRVSQKFVGELEVQDDSDFGIDTNIRVVGRRVGQQLTVRLQWRWKTLTHTLENWFLVTDEPIDIVIGSEILFSLAMYELQHMDLREASITETRPLLPESTDLSQGRASLDSPGVISPDEKKLFPSSKQSRTRNTSIAKTNDFRSIAAFVGAVHIIYRSTEEWYTEDYTLTVRYGSMRIRYHGFDPALILDCRITKWVTSAEFQLAAYNSSLIDASIGE